MKTCGTCHKTLDISFFCSDKTKKDRKHTRCKNCSKIYSANYRKNHPEKQKNIEMKIRYGITLIEYESLLLKQDGVCKICKQTCKTGFNLAVDHCHMSKKVRGLLCTKCNRGIGMFNDNPNLLLAAIEYLKNNQEVK